MKVLKQYWRLSTNLFNQPSAQECVGAHLINLKFCSDTTKAHIQNYGYRVWHIPPEKVHEVDGAPDFITWVDTTKYQVHDGTIKPVGWDRM